MKSSLVPVIFSYVTASAFITSLSLISEEGDGVISESGFPLKHPVLL